MLFLFSYWTILIDSGTAGKARKGEQRARQLTGSSFPSLNPKGPIDR